MGFSVEGISQARILEWVAIPGDLSDPEIEPRSPALQADSLPSEPPKKPQPPAKTAPNAIYSVAISNHNIPKNPKIASSIQTGTGFRDGQREEGPYPLIPTTSRVCAYVRVHVCLWLVWQ